MRVSYILFVGALLVSASSYVGSHEDIVSFYTLGTPQHMFGLLGVVGSVIGAYFAKSPNSK